MRIGGWGHISEATLAELADGASTVAHLSPPERRHLETCDRCQGLLEGHRRAGRLLAAPWKPVRLDEAAAAAGAPMPVVKRVAGGRLIGSAGTSGGRPRVAIGVAGMSLLAVLAVVLWNGGGLLVGGAETPSPAIATFPAPSPSGARPSEAPSTPPPLDPGFKPEHVAVDALGRVYTTDCARGTVFRVGDPGGPVVVAGSGVSGGFGGDGGPAIEAKLECPYGIAFDAAGNLFVADTGNNRVRMVDADGVITTIAGSGPVGWGAPSLEGDGGLATEARLGNPAGIAFDALGNLYVADMRNGRIRKVDRQGVITTLAGDGTLIPTFRGDGGPAIEATLNDPQGIAVDSHGNIYFVDTHNNRLRMIDRDGRITTVAGTGELASYGDEGPAIEAALAAPRAVIVDAAGNIYVSEAVWDVVGVQPAVPAGVGNRVRWIDTDGIIHPFAGTGEIGFAGDGGPAIEAHLNAVNQNFGLAIDAAGNVYIADSGNQRIRVVDATGTIRTFADGSR